MNADQRRLYVDALAAIEARCAELKRLVDQDQPQTTGCHWLVHSLAGIESLTWGARDAVSRESVGASSSEES